MHESSLAKQILDAVLDRAHADGAARVRSIRGWVAETETLSADSLRVHFAAHAHGTLADGAQLDLRLIHVEARCASCNKTYAPDHHVLICPACGSAEGELLGPTGLGVDVIEVESS